MFCGWLCHLLIVSQLQTPFSTCFVMLKLGFCKPHFYLPADRKRTEERDCKVGEENGDTAVLCTSCWLPIYLQFPEYHLDNAFSFPWVAAVGFSLHFFQHSWSKPLRVTLTVPASTNSVTSSGVGDPALRGLFSKLRNTSTNWVAKPILSSKIWVSPIQNHSSPPKFLNFKSNLSFLFFQSQGWYLIPVVAASMVQLLFNCSVMSNSLLLHGLQHARLPCPSPSPGAYANSCPLSRWCHPTISSSVVPFSSCLRSFPASGSFLMSWPFASGDQSIGASVSASILPMNIQDWFPLGLTDLISLQSKGLSRIFSNTTVQRHQFFNSVFFFFFSYLCVC